MSSVFVITMGGTIEKCWNVEADETNYPKESQIVTLLRERYDLLTFDHTIVHMGESTEIDNDKLEALVKAIKQSQSKRVLITHGPNTLENTVSYLQAHEQELREFKISIACSSFPMDLKKGQVEETLGNAMSVLHNLRERLTVVIDGKVTIRKFEQD